MLKRSGFVARLAAVGMVLLAPAGAAAAGQAPAGAAAAGQAPVAQPGPVLGAPPAVQAPLPLATVCGQQARPVAQPPAGSGPVVLYIAPCFAAQGGTSLIEAETYVYYIQLKTSQPSQAVWIPYDESSEQTMREDWRRLWATNFLDNLSIEVNDYMFPNGTVGKIVQYNMEERQRVKIVEYVGSKKIETSKIDERLKEANSEVRLDTFIDEGLVRKVEGIVRDMMKDKGFQDAEVTHEIKEVPGGPKLVNLTFQIDEGPNVKVRKLVFTGNKDVSSGTLKRQMKGTKEEWILSFMTGRGTFQEARFDQDAEKVIEYYQNRGYIKAVVGAPTLKPVGTSKDRKTRYIELQIPVTEGPRYKVGTVEIAGNTVVKTDRLMPFFKLAPGEYYSLKSVRTGLEKARESYGQGGYWEFTGFPEYKFRDDPEPVDAATPAALKPAPGPAVVDITMRVVEGQQYFINRITFVGNTTTHDTVIRRELRMLEDGVFDTEALKVSVKRLNQLGYFKPLEGNRDVDVAKTPGQTNKVDVKLRLEEQNRNQISFGAGVSEFEGFFGQASFQTSNFLGRGENLTLSLQAGSRAQNYNLAFTEPFLFDRNITGTFNVFRSDVRYINQFTQRSTGGAIGFGYPLGGFTRLFTNYSYQRVRVTEINQAYTDPLTLARNPFLRDSLLIGANGERTISKVTPSLVHNTVDQPIFPTQGKRFTASLDLAGIGGNTKFYQPRLEAIYFWRQNARFSLGMRAEVQYIHPFDGSQELPIFQKLFLGGEYSVRGFDIRSIGPKDATTGLVLGGNKSLLFNLEQNINIAGPVRLILFFDTGQVRGEGDSFSFKETNTERVVSIPLLLDPDTTNHSPLLLSPIDICSAKGTISCTTSQVAAFKASTGAEVRFFMPVLNVPFRLIFAYNPSRAGVLTTNLVPQSAFQFRFAVGTTF